MRVLDHDMVKKVAIVSAGLAVALSGVLFGMRAIQTNNNKQDAEQPAVVVPPQTEEQLAAQVKKREGFDDVKGLQASGANSEAQKAALSYARDSTNGLTERLNALVICADVATKASLDSDECDKEFESVVASAPQEDQQSWKTLYTNVKNKNTTIDEAGDGLR